MALTQRELQALLRHDMDKFYAKHKNLWEERARRAYEYTSQTFPAGEKPRIDDVAGVLEPILEIDESLVAFLQENKLSQKYWVRYFCDYILDQVWPSLSR